MSTRVGAQVRPQGTPPAGARRRQAAGRVDRYWGSRARARGRLARTSGPPPGSRRRRRQGPSGAVRRVAGARCAARRRAGRRARFVVIRVGARALRCYSRTSLWGGAVESQARSDPTATLGRPRDFKTTPHRPKPRVASTTGSQRPHGVAAIPSGPMGYGGPMGGGDPVEGGNPLAPLKEAERLDEDVWIRGVVARLGAAPEVGPGAARVRSEGRPGLLSGVGGALMPQRGPGNFRCIGRAGFFPSRALSCNS